MFINICGKSLGTAIHCYLCSIFISYLQNCEFISNKPVSIEQLIGVIRSKIQQMLTNFKVISENRELLAVLLNNLGLIVRLAYVVRGLRCASNQTGGY